MSKKVSNGTPESGMKKVVKNLTDNQQWSWLQEVRRDDAAQEVLSLLHENGFIGHHRHRGGDIWIVDGKIYGDTEGHKIVNGKVQEKKRKKPAKKEGRNLSTRALR